MTDFIQTPSRDDLYERILKLEAENEKLKNKLKDLILCLGVLDLSEEQEK